jgi:hypothetical protein
MHQIDINLHLPSSTMASPARSERDRNRASWWRKKLGFLGLLGAGLWNIYGQCFVGRGQVIVPESEIISHSSWFKRSRVRIRFHAQMSEVERKELGERRAGTSFTCTHAAYTHARAWPAGRSCAHARSHEAACAHVRCT